ncbi:MAG: hypothetical protein AAF799_24860 [Myxococcota bacterium]
MKPWIGLLAVLGSGCPAPFILTDTSSSNGDTESTSEGATTGPGATSVVPGTTSGSGGADTTSGTSPGTSSGTTSDPSTGTTAGDDFGDVAEGPVCHSCCGNGIIDATEQCDCAKDFCTPEGLNFAECAGLTNPAFPDRIYTGGLLDCGLASCQYRFDLCGYCGDTVIGDGENCELDRPPTDTCESLGLGPGTEPLPCTEFCQLDTSSCAP